MNESSKSLLNIPLPVNITEHHVKRFWERVVKTESCWIWKKVSGKGYGRFKIGKRMVGAHRASWVIHNGPIPDGLCVLHNCPNGDNPSCVNPDHLWVGTNQQNTDDCIAKGRFPMGSTHPLVLRPENAARGEDNGRAKLTPEKVIEIRKISSEQGLLNSVIGKMFGVSGSAIYLILKRRNWKHV